MVESQPSKLLVAGSIPVSRSIRLRPREVRAGYGEMPRRSGEAAKAVWGTEREGRVGRLRAEARGAKADVAQLAERVLGKDEVTGSIPVIGSNLSAVAQGANADRGSRKKPRRRTT